MKVSRLSLPVLGVALLAGCSSIKPLPLEVHDTKAPHAMLRGVLRPGVAAGGGGLELELTRVRGSSQQRRGEFDPVELGGVDLSDAAVLRNEASHQSLQAVYHHRLFAGRPFEMAWFVGAATGHLDWTSTEQGGLAARAATRVRWAGPTGGVSGRLNFAPQWFGELRYAVTPATSGDKSNGRSQLEAALGWQAAPTVQLRLGWASTGVKYQLDNQQGELHFRARGPFAGLVLGY